MARFRKRRRRFRRKRKMGLTRRIKRVVRKIRKKTVEMKFDDWNLAITPVTSTGLLTEFFGFAAIPEGTGPDDRIGQHINMYRWMIHLTLFGTSAPTSSAPQTTRLIVAYARNATAATDFPPTVDGFMDLEQARGKGIYVIRDWKWTLAPQVPVVTTLADSFATQARAHPMTRFRDFKINLKGRNRAYDNISITNGFLYIYAITDPVGAQANLLQARTRLFYTDS